ncbi:hypothetical protein [Endozoicomonas sp.]|uniref:hypothetical protein n=1 Tax=Endozoicomonas sp. TaxID=1892382 RepID=UPI003AF5F776
MNNGISPSNTVISKELKLKSCLKKKEGSFAGITVGNINLGQLNSRYFKSNDDWSRKITKGMTRKVSCNSGSKEFDEYFKDDWNRKITRSMARRINSHRDTSERMTADKIWKTVRFSEELATVHAYIN